MFNLDASLFSIPVLVYLYSTDNVICSILLNVGGRPSSEGPKVTEGWVIVIVGVPGRTDNWSLGNNYDSVKLSKNTCLTVCYTGSMSTSFSQCHANTIYIEFFAVN